MVGFTHTKLKEGEVLVLGPVTFSSSSSFSFNAGGAQAAQVSRSNVRMVGVTSQRVIVESQGGDQVILNSDVKRVFVRREGRGTRLEKVETRSGQSVKLDLAGLSPVHEARLFELFPGAEIGEQKGLFGGFSRITPRVVPAMPAPRVPPGVRPAAPAARKSHIDDADIKTLDDLRRYYPLPAEYEYVQAPDGEYLVRRLGDGAQFPILCEEELLGFDVPIQDPKRRKVTVEVFKKK